MVKIDMELDNCEKTVYKMSRKVIGMHEHVLKLLETNDKNLAIQIVQEDDFVNKLEEEINDLAITSLALLSPVATDLRRVITAIKIAGELERIGDYAKNIAFYMLQHESCDKDILDYLSVMMKNMINLLTASMKAYEEKDVEVALQIPEKDKQIDLLHKELLEKLAKEKKIDKDLIFMLIKVVRSIERAGDHSVNICEHIIYLVKGQHYDFG